MEPFFGFYFRGFARLVDLIPDSLLYRLVIRKNYDIEIGYCMSLPIKIIAASKRDCLHLAWMHGYDEGLTLIPSYKKVHKVICVSKSAAERFAKETNHEIPVEYSYNLVDDETVIRMGSESITLPDTRDITFVCVGRHEPGKGYMNVVECIGKLKKNGYRVQAWLIGNGPQHAELKNRAEQLGVTENVFFLGEQRNPHAYTSKADVFVCSSFSEGYSTACTEAIMLGVPVLTTDVGGAREIIEDANCGMVVGMRVDDLYDGMKHILDHPELVSVWKKILEQSKYVFSKKERAARLKNILDI